jgi:mRNA-degrading endonuclease toxin of MazEF toxin-antitoxin module
MRRGDIVEIEWQFSDLTGSKIRPAVIVQADYLNGLIDDTILVKITGSHFGIPGTEVMIDPTVETASGLNKICYASCKDILTRDQTLVLGTVGVLSDAAMRQIESCLKATLEIPNEFNWNSVS